MSESFLQLTICVTLLVISCLALLCHSVLDFEPAPYHDTGESKWLGNLTTLVWFEQGDDVMSAIAREKQLKNWHRDWKVALIENDNREWNDLYDSIVR